MRRRWALAIATGGQVAFDEADDFAQVIDRSSPNAAIGVDIPIGLPAAGPREADRLARARLPGAASRVFPTPIRATLAHRDDYQGALAASRAADGRGLSKQAFFLLDAIADVDAHLPDGRIREVHPEVSFAAMAGGGPLSSKKSSAGRQERVSAIVPALASMGLALDARSIPGEDHLDALACLWTAARVARGTAVTLPHPAPLDALGRPMAITY